MAEQQYFHDCLLGLAYTEEMCRKWCMTDIGIVHRKTSIELRGVLECIINTEKYKIKRKGWLSAVLDHTCHRHPACNNCIVHFLEKLPCASIQKRTGILKAICQKDDFEFAKIFVKPWMRTFRSFAEMDAYCLFLLLENVCVFHHEESPARQALYQEHIGKIRRIAESCLQEDVQGMTKADRDTCLQAIINGLALVRGRDADEVIHNIEEIIYLTSRDIQMTKDTFARRSDLKKTINAFHREVIQSVSDFLHTKPVSGAGLVVPSYTMSVELELTEAEGSAIDDRTSEDWAKKAGEIMDDTMGLVKIEDLFRHQTGPSHYQLVKNIVDNGFQSGLDELFSHKIRESFPASSRDCTTLDKTAYIYFQVAVYYLENANFGNDAVRSLLEALISPNATSDEMKKEHVATLENALSRHGPAYSLQEILDNEMKSKYFKVCHQTILTVENDLRQYCKEKMVMIHREVKQMFPRLSLCQLTARDGTDRVIYHPPAEIKFKHDCKKECNTFLSVVLSKRSATCSLSPRKMFTSVNPRVCLDNVWEFAKLFLEPCMHIFHSFEELDTFCLLTLLANVQMFDGIQSETETFLRKVCKARDLALIVLGSSKQELAKQTMESCVEEIVFILEKCIFPGIIRQIKAKTHVMVLPLSDTRPFTDFTREQRIQKFYEQINIRDKDECNWLRICLALKSIQPSLVPIVDKTMNDLQKDMKDTFGRTLCTEAKREDIERTDDIPYARFKHTCSVIGHLECNSVLNIIKNLTLKSSDLYSMVGDTDPQTWFSTPFDLTRIFLKDWMKLQINQLEDCDVGAICHLIKQCQPLRKLFVVKQEKKDQKDLMNPVRAVRNRIMHCSSMEISQKEMEDDIDVILDMLRHIENVQVGNTVTDAIKTIVQIKTGELKLLRHEEIQLLQDVKAGLNRKLTQHEVLMKRLSQNITKLEETLRFPKSSYSGDIVEGDQAGNGTATETNTREVDKHLDLWCRCALALKYLHYVWLPLVEKEMDLLYLETSRQSRRKLCSKANSKGITKDGNNLKFEDHLCTCDCNGLLEDIQNLFPKSVDTISLLRDSDPKTWLRSRFEFQCIFMKKRIKSEIKQFKDCDISALCDITKCCQPLKEKTDEPLVTKVRSVRNTMVHCATMEMNPKEMEYIIDAVLAFIRHLNKNITSIDLAEANANIEKLRSGGLTLLHGKDLRLLHEFVFDMKRELTVKTVEMTELSKRITDMEQAISNVVSKGTLSGRTIKDTGNDEGKPSITIKDWKFDRFTVVDQAELDRKWQEKHKRIQQMKEGIQSAIRNKKIQLEKEKEDILISIQKEREKRDMRMKETDELWSTKRDLEKRIDRLREESEKKKMTGALFLGATLLTGGMFGMAATAGAALLAGTAAGTTGIMLGLGTANILIGLDLSTEEGCRRGIEKIELERSRNDRLMDSNLQIISLLNERLKEIDNKLTKVIPDLNTRCEYYI